MQCQKNKQIPNRLVTDILLEESLPQIGNKGPPADIKTKPDQGKQPSLNLPKRSSAMGISDCRENNNNNSIK